MEHFDPRAGITDPTGAPDGPHRRRTGRVDAEALYCQFGPVIDLSSGGMRVHCRRAPVGEVDIMLYGGHEGLKVRARVAWKKRISLFKHEVGFQFLNLDPEMTRKLTTMATTSRQRRAM